jgi:hypothetical protein
MKKLRFGFLSTANIGRKNWKAIFHSRQLRRDRRRQPRCGARSRKFIRECQARRRLKRRRRRSAATRNCSRQKTWTPFTFRCRPACAGNGSCARRRPASMSSAKNRAPSTRPILVEMLSACRKNNVQFMDGVMFMHSPRLGADPRNARRRRERRPDQAHRLAIQFSRKRGIFPRQHPRECRARTRRLSRRPRLVLHPVRAVGDELANAARSFRHFAGANGFVRADWNFPANCFLTAAFPRVFTARFSRPSGNGRTSAARKAICACRFCGAVLRRRKRV